MSGATSMSSCGAETASPAISEGGVPISNDLEAGREAAEVDALSDDASPEASGDAGQLDAMADAGDAEAQAPQIQPPLPNRC